MPSKHRHTLFGRGAFALAPAAQAATNGSLGFTAYASGDPADVVAPMASGTLLSGGGTDDDAATRWLLGKVDVVVLDADGGDIYGGPFLAWAADSVETFVLSSPTGASAAQVLDAIDHAEVIWLDRGHPSTYVTAWAGTLLQAHINARIAQGAAFGGMSAGLAVQGGWIFTAQHGSITSDMALANPYNRDVTMGGALFDLPYMDNVLTDTHVGLRDRMGRLLPFLARLEQDHGAVAPFVVAVDEGTSIDIDAQTGVAQVFGVGDGVWLASTDTVTTRLVAPKTPLTDGPVTIQHLSTGDTFDFSPWASPDGDADTVSPTGGVLSATAPGTPYEAGRRATAAAGVGRARAPATAGLRRASADEAGKRPSP